jgi:hypothetical protein
MDVPDPNVPLELHAVDVTVEIASPLLDVVTSR